MSFYKSLLTCMVVGSLLGCEKQGSIYKGEGEDIKLTDVKIPAGFDWRTSDEIECHLVAATHPSRIEVYARQNCDADSRIASIYVDQQSEPVKLVVRRGAEQVFLRYQDKGGVFQTLPLAISGQKVNIVVPEDSRNFSGVTTKGHDDNDDDKDEDDDEEDNKLEFDFEGTKLFEDNYPQKGDYDFNDYVVEYDFDATFKSGRGVAEDELKLEIELEFVAKGGIFDYEPYLRLKGMTEEMTMSKVEIKYEGKKVEGVTIECVSAAGQERIYKLAGVSRAMVENMKMEGSQYVNTTYNCTTPHFLEIKFDLKRKAEHIDYRRGEDIFDLFLAKEVGGKLVEIHEKRFGSTYLSGENIADGAYCTEDNYVWALDINEDVYEGHHYGKDLEVFPYLREEVNFLKGYPDFKEYIQHGKTDWYKKYNKEYLIFMKD